MRVSVVAGFDYLDNGDWIKAGVRIALENGERLANDAGLAKGHRG